MIKYKKHYNNSIEKCEILRETAHSIWRNISYTNWVTKVTITKEVQERKKTEGESWHDTYEKAKQSVVDDKQNTVNNLERQLLTTKEELIKAQNLKEDAV